MKKQDLIRLGLMVTMLKTSPSTVTVLCSAFNAEPQLPNLKGMSAIWASCKHHELLSEVATVDLWKQVCGRGWRGDAEGARCGHHPERGRARAYRAHLQLRLQGLSSRMHLSAAHS